MLPFPNSAPPSPNPSIGDWDEHYDDSDGKHKLRASALADNLPFGLRRFLAAPLPPQHRKPATYGLGAVAFFLCYFILFRSGGGGGGAGGGGAEGVEGLGGKAASRAHEKLRWGSHQNVENWGDHVGLGRAREGVLERTPSPYVDIGDHWKGGGDGALYRTRRTLQEMLEHEGEDGDELELEERMVQGERNWEFERDRHGVMGGSSVEWSSGVVGSGTFLGSYVDMRKDTSSSLAPTSPAYTSLERRALTSHILQFGWQYLDAEDQLNTEDLISRALKEGWMDSLPLRDRVRGDEEKELWAAEGWSRIYTVMEGQWRKSALEVGLEKMVRRVPVVVFSKTTCPHSKRAKALLAQYHLLPLPLIVEVDLRPDAVPLKGLLKRRTNHGTFPNIIIGGRSIGGADDLERLARTGDLSRLLREVGVRHGGAGGGAGEL